MNDILPPESHLWAEIEKKARVLFRHFGFSEIITPVAEKTELFTHSVGQATDIIEKQMYTFEDKNGEKISLRPEGTAPVVRSYLEHNLFYPDPYRKLYYWGPMYRYERMQKGRYRQFYQYGVEIFGTPSPRIDAETIFMLTEFYREVGLQKFEVQVNSLGCSQCRPAFREKLLQYLPKYESDLCVDCRRRLKKNPLRVLDCKEEKCMEIANQAPQLIKMLCEACHTHFNLLRESLHQLNVDFVENSKIIRGLDYYMRTAFEIVSYDLGSQNALGGGGRYDGLVKSLGGTDIPAFGFAGGVERLLLVLPQKDLKETIDLFIAALGEKSQAFSFGFIHKLRKKGVRCDIDYDDHALKTQMKKADRLNAKYTLLMGEDEISKGIAILRNMITKEQKSIRIANLLEDIVREIQI